MPGFYLHTSNRIEYLVEKMTDIISQAPLQPMEQEIIVIPSAGMERYIAFFLAQKQQICANIQFPFPNAFIQNIFHTVLSDIPQRSPYNPDMLCWHIMKHLPSMLAKNAFTTIRHYLSDDPDRIKFFQLCRKIADLYDHYTVYRPDMLMDWESGKAGDTLDDRWQAELWRMLTGTISDPHRVILRKRFFEALKGGGVKNLPKRISLFGISYLPPFHTHILHALSNHTDIHCFTLNPCMQFWDDITSQKYTAKKSVQALQQQKDIQLLHYETGNELLASLGSYGREFLSLLHSLPCEESSEFTEPSESTLLGMLQSDILHLRTHESPVPISTDDQSIQIHVCHSPLREIEVLHNSLLSFFEQDPLLTPEDIIVMIPDIETYVPYIQTVFETASGSTPYIPYSIADMTTRSGNRIINDFLAILDLRQNRFSAAGVLAILESENVCNTLGIGEDEREQIHTWIADTGIRWGIDEKYRAQLGMPRTAENTWQAGLDRLFLGYALSSDSDDTLFESIPPYEAIQSSDASLLGIVAEFFEKLVNTAQHLEQERTPDEWAAFLSSVLDTFFAAHPSNAFYLDLLYRTIADLSVQQHATGFEQKVPFSVIRYYLESLLNRKEYGTGFMSGGITFCTLLPMRSIPFKVLCLAGMNDGSFPRKDSPVSFDLVATRQQAGDRSLRKEDRYCFLESLLSARERLYISYTGHSVLDNSSIPPSVLVSELTDYCSQYYTAPAEPGGLLADHITTHHRLHGCHKDYFLQTAGKNQRYFSYAQDYAEAASAHREEIPAFMTAALPLPDDHDAHQVTLEQLCAFLTHPVKYFCRNRLGMTPATQEDIAQENEPFSLDGLAHYLLEQKLLEKKIAGASPGDCLASMKAHGILPHGTVGACTFNRVCEDIEQFAAAIMQAPVKLSGQSYRDIHLTLNHRTITGRIGGITKDTLVLYRPASIKARDRLRLWLYHLVLAVLYDESLPQTGLLIGKDSQSRIQAVQYTAVEDAATLLEALLHLFAQAAARPVPFFPASSFVYAHALHSGKTEEYALQKAQETWFGNPYNRGECDDFWYAFFPGSHDPFTRDFIDTAAGIYQPLLEHEQPVVL